MISTQQHAEHTVLNKSDAGKEIGFEQVLAWGPQDRRTRQVFMLADGRLSIARIAGLMRMELSAKTCKTKMSK
jgi:hypothetical protein